MTDFNAFDDLDLDCTTESDLTPEQQAEIDAVWDTLTEDDQ